MKRIASLFLTALLLVIAAALPAAAKEATGVTADGSSVNFDVQPGVKDGVLMVPVRAVAEALGGEVSWAADQQVVTIKSGKTTVTLTIGKSTAQVNGHDVPLQAPVVLQGNRTMVPAGFLLTLYGQKLTIANPGVKDPLAMALLEKAQKAAQTQFDLQMDQQVTMEITNPQKMTMPFSTSTKAQVRGNDALMSVATKMPQLPGGGTSMLVALKGGKTFVKAGDKWQEVPTNQGAASATQSLNTVQGLITSVREAHLGASRTVGGQTVQDVVITYDVAALKAVTDQVLKGMVPGDPSLQVNLTWESATATISVDTATGSIVGQQTMDAAMSLTVSDKVDKLSLHMVIHQVASTTPNDKAIAWPTDLP